MYYYLDVLRAVARDRRAIPETRSSKGWNHRDTS